MNDLVVVGPNTKFVIIGGFGEASLLAARMNLSLSEWIHLETEGIPNPVIFSRLNDEETASLIVPDSGRPFH